VKLPIVFGIALVTITNQSIAQELGEVLVVSVPEYWSGSQVLIERNNGNGASTLGRIPGDQSKAGYEESLWEERIPLPPRPITLSQFSNAMLTQYWRQCQTLRTTPAKTTTENGYEVTYVQATCNRVKAEPHKGIIVRAKFIKTSRNLYSIAHEFALKSFEPLRGGDASVVPVQDDALGAAEKAEHFLRYNEKSFKHLETGAFVCESKTQCSGISSTTIKTDAAR
jgi:hypothetical protein